MEFNKTEHIAKLYDIMKAEGTYLKYLRFIKRGAHKITQDIVCSCFSGTWCRNKHKNCKKYRIVAYERGR